MPVRYKANSQNWSLFPLVYIEVTLEFDTIFHQIALVSKGTSFDK